MFSVFNQVFVHLVQPWNSLIKSSLHIHFIYWLWNCFFRKTQTLPSVTTMMLCSSVRCITIYNWHEKKTCSGLTICIYCTFWGPSLYVVIKFSLPRFIIFDPSRIEVNNRWGCVVSSVQPDTQQQVEDNRTGPTLH